MSLASQVSLLATRIATEVKAKQPLDSDLTSIAALTTTSFGRSLLTSADATALRATLSMAAIATSGSASDLTTGTIPDARLPARLAPTGSNVVTDADSATIAGWWTVSTSTHMPAGFGTGTDLLVVGGGTGGSSYLTQITINPPNLSMWFRTNFGVGWSSWIRVVDKTYGDTLYQPLDSDLTAIAAVSTASFGRALLGLGNSGALAAQVGTADETNAGVVTLATQLMVNTGTDDARPMTSLKLQTKLAAGYQPLDSDLTAIAALTTTSYGRAFLSLANQAALVALLPSYQPLDSDLTAIAALSTTAYGQNLLALADIAAARAYINASGTYAKLATVSNDTLSGLAARDGVTPSAGDVVLVPAQTSQSANGLYLAAAGAWSRAPWADSALEVATLGPVQVQSGTANGGTRWTTGFKSTDTLGTTAMTWFRVEDTAGPHARRTNNAGTTGLTSVAPAYTVLDYPTVVDTHVGIIWDGTNKRFAVPRTGRYQINAHVLATGVSGQSYALVLVVNGTLVEAAWNNCGAGGFIGVFLNDTLMLNLGDTVAIGFQSTSATAVQVLGASDNRAPVSVSFLGP